MNSLERTQRSIRGESIDQIPHFPISLASTCQIMKVKQRDFSLDADIMAETLVDFREKVGCDGIYVSRDNWVYHQAFGGELVFPEDDESFSNKTVLGSMDEYKRLSLPDPWNAPGMKTLLKAARLVVEAVGDEIYIQANIDTGPFSLAAILLGTEKFLLEIMTAEHEKTQEFLQFCTDAVVRYGKAMIETGVHGIQFGDSTASLVGPAQFRDFALPWIKKSVSELTNRGSDIWIHICGKTDQFLHLLNDVNLQGFEVDAKVPLPLARELLGNHIAIKGNLDTSYLLQKTSEEVYEATLDILNTCRFKTGFIMSPGCGVPRNTPLENLQAMQKACEDFQI